MLSQWCALDLCRALSQVRAVPLELGCAGRRGPSEVVCSDPLQPTFRVIPPILLKWWPTPISRGA